LLVAYGGYAFARADATLSTWDATLNSRYGYAAFRKASALEPRYGSRLMQVGFEGSAYFFDGTAMGDWFGLARYSQTVAPGALKFKLIPAARMRAVMKSFDAKMLAVNLTFADYDAADYGAEFDVILKDDKQALLALKPAS
jgi:hypothetical protein